MKIEESSAGPVVVIPTDQPANPLALDTTPPEPETPPPPRRERRFQPPVSLRHRDFALLWGGQAVSQIGTQMQIVGTAWLLWQRNHSALALGLVGLFRAVPLVLFALFGGVIADAFDGRRLMFFTQSSLMVLSLKLALATGANTVPHWLIYAYIAGAAIASQLDNPARQALVPSLVP